MVWTKAQTLTYISGKLSTAKVLQTVVIKRADFDCDSEQVFKRLTKQLDGVRTIIVRSSSVLEDTEFFSNAGRFTSILNVDSSDRAAVATAIGEVLASYGSEAPDDEVLIQPMLPDVIRSGVAFTCDIDTGAPYYTINYAESQDTAAVTSGKTNQLKTLVVFKTTKESVKDTDLKHLITALEELENILSWGALDVEFAFDSTHRLYIFQARPIANGRKEKFTGLDLQRPLERLYKKVEKLMRPHPFLLGESTCFGVMPDWNPAEILGVRPKKLAISLYKELVTDDIWAHQRNDYGYRDLTMHPLMVSFCGIPYIDTRVTFNSFIPKGLKTSIADKLANYYIDSLKNYPAYHDKIEFEIVYSCYYIGLSDNLQKLLAHGFNENELKRIEFSLLELTNAIIHPENGLYKQDIEKARMLLQIHRKIMESKISLIDKIYWLLEDCKKYGTLPFAGVARAGFIAAQFLRSFVASGLIEQSDYDAFMKSLNTVSKQLSHDRGSLLRGEISREAFLEKYGHIRPGTYDILSKRYDENFDYYFAERRANEPQVSPDADYRFNPTQMERIQQELEENGLEVTAEQLLQFIREAIEGREAVKFEFTKCVSDILRLIGQLGVRNRIELEDMAHLDISVIKQLYVDLYYDDLHKVLRNNIEMNKKQFAYARQIKLPSVIVQPEDVYCFYLLEDEPNFVTLKQVCAETIQEFELANADVGGKIVLIQSADPGYDFLFAKNIGGLITQFGGANSHMAIRCAELGIPAVIGAGEKNYSVWRTAHILNIDCASHQVNIEG